MNFNVYIDDASVRRLDALAKKRKVARNALVREAVKVFLDGATTKPDRWPDAVFDFVPDPTFPPFESHRAELLPVNEDPLGLLAPRASQKPRVRRKRSRR